MLYNSAADWLVFQPTHREQRHSTSVQGGRNSAAAAPRSCRFPKRNVELVCLSTGHTTHLRPGLGEAACGPAFEVGSLRNTNTPPENSAFRNRTHAGRQAGLCRCVLVSACKLKNLLNKGCGLELVLVCFVTLEC
jgi:hypothetical protein